MENILPVYTLGIIIIFVLWMWKNDKQLIAKEREDFAEERQSLIDSYHAEIKDLLDRVQAPNFETYKAHVEETPNEVDETDDVEVIDLDDAREQLEGAEDNG